MINNIAIPFIASLALGKNKNLTKQESAKAAMMSYAGSAVGGSAGAVLGSMSAVNAESLQNQLERSDAQKKQAERDRRILLENIKKGDDGKTYIIEKTDAVDAIFKRFNKFPVANTTPGSNGDSAHAISHLDDTLTTLNNNLQAQSVALTALVAKLTSNGTVNPAPAGSASGSATGTGSSGTPAANPSPPSPESSTAAKASKGTS